MTELSAGTARSRKAETKVSNIRGQGLIDDITRVYESGIIVPRNPELDKAFSNFAINLRAEMTAGLLSPAAVNTAIKVSDREYRELVDNGLSETRNMAARLLKNFRRTTVPLAGGGLQSLAIILGDIDPHLAAHSRADVRELATVFGSADKLSAVGDSFEEPIAIKKYFKRVIDSIEELSGSIICPVDSKHRELFDKINLSVDMMKSWIGKAAEHMDLTIGIVDNTSPAIKTIGMLSGFFAMAADQVLESTLPAEMIKEIGYLRSKEDAGFNSRNKRRMIWKEVCDIKKQILKFADNYTDLVDIKSEKKKKGRDLRKPILHIAQTRANGIYGLQIGTDRFDSSRMEVSLFTPFGTVDCCALTGDSLKLKEFKENLLRRFSLEAESITASDLAVFGAKEGDLFSVRLRNDYFSNLEFRDKSKVVHAEVLGALWRAALSPAERMLLGETRLQKLLSKLKKQAA